MRRVVLPGFPVSRNDPVRESSGVTSVEYKLCKLHSVLATESFVHLILKKGTDTNQASWVVVEWGELKPTGWWEEHQRYSVRQTRTPAFARSSMISKN